MEKAIAELADRLEAGFAEDCERSGIKIAQVISRLCIGGTPVAVILATEFLRNAGYSIQLVTGTVMGDECDMEEFAIRRGLHPTKVPSLSQRNSLWKDLKSLWQLFRFFRTEKPAIVHTHTAKAGALGRIAARLAGVPICVHTFHGHVFQGHFSGSQSRVYLAIEMALAKWTDCLVAVSRSQEKELVEKYRVAPAGKFVTIPVAFDLDCYLKLNGHRGFIREQLDCAADSPVIGWVGRLTAIKNPELFLDVVELTLQARPDAKFVIAGDGELRGPLEKQLTARNLSAATKMIGWQSDLSDFYADIDVVVMTSRHEGTPLTLLEAMASGKPFVSTDVGGIRDLVAGTADFVDAGVQVFDNGILAGPSADGLASGIRYLLERPQRAREMGSAGRRFASRTFGADQSGRELESLYLKLLKQKSMG